MKLDFDAIDWDNWKIDEGFYSGKSKDGKYWDITEVLYCKLNWIKQRLEEDNQYNDEIDDNTEYVEALDMVMSILENLNKEKIEKL